jgi:hypothetical protein
VTGAQRAKNADHLNPIVQEWLLSFPTDEAVTAVLEENRIACSSVLSVVDTMKHPHYKVRNMVRTGHDPILGEVTIPGFPLKFSATIAEQTSPRRGDCTHAYRRAAGCAPRVRLNFRPLPALAACGICRSIQALCITYENPLYLRSGLSLQAGFARGRQNSGAR